MGTIDIKTQQLESAINDLYSIQQKLNAAKKAPPSTIGGGKTVSQLENIGKIYQDMNQHLSMMIDSTILMLKNAKEGFETSDSSMASKIRQ